MASFEKSDSEETQNTNLHEPAVRSEKDNQVATAVCWGRKLHMFAITRKTYKKLGKQESSAESELYNKSTNASESKIKM